jgi:two-component system OmpR family response regulator
MLAEYLTGSGLHVTAAENATDGIAEIARTSPDAVVLDVMLPDMDGFEALRRIRQTSDVPVLMLTARGDETDRIVGLEIGADDYLPKPFNPRELVARARAILRRTREANRVVTAPPDRYGFAGWSLDAGARCLADPEGRPVELTAGEFDLLLSFVTHAQRVLSRDQLLDWTRGRNAGPFDRAIDVQLSRLRRKLCDHPAGAGLIKTVRGGGYLFAAPVDRG